MHSSRAFYSHLLIHESHAQLSRILFTPSHPQGALSFDEFCVAMQLVTRRKAGESLPVSLPRIHSALSSTLAATLPSTPSPLFSSELPVLANSQTLPSAVPLDHYTQLDHADAIPTGGAEPRGFYQTGSQTATQGDRSGVVANPNPGVLLSK